METSSCPEVEGDCPLVGNELLKPNAAAVGREFVIAISGTTEPLGMEFASYLAKEVKQIEGSPIKIIHLVRNTQFSGDRALLGQSVVVVGPQYTGMDLDQLECCDAFVHLAGETFNDPATLSRRMQTCTNVQYYPNNDFASRTADSVWAEEKTLAAQKNNVAYTEELVALIRKLNFPPKIFICASDVSIYKCEDGKKADEKGELATHSFAEYVKQKEKCLEALPTPCEVAVLRVGLVLSSNDGIVPRLVQLLDAGIHGQIGSGAQLLPLVTIHDAIRALTFVLSKFPTDDVKGVWNVSKPTAETANALVDKVYQIYGNCCATNFFPLKAPDLTNISRLTPFSDTERDFLLGTLRKPILFEGSNVSPKRLTDRGFAFLHNDLHSAIFFCYDNDETPDPSDGWTVGYTTASTFATADTLRQSFDSKGSVKWDGITKRKKVPATVAEKVVSFCGENSELQTRENGPQGDKHSLQWDCYNGSGGHTDGTTTCKTPCPSLASGSTSSADWRGLISSSSSDSMYDHI